MCPQDNRIDQRQAPHHLLRWDVERQQLGRQPGAALRSEGELAEDLRGQKRELYARAVGMKKDTEKIAKAYREMLVKASQDSYI